MASHRCGFWPPGWQPSPCLRLHNIELLQLQQIFRLRKLCKLRQRMQQIFRRRKLCKLCQRLKTSQRRKLCILRQRLKTPQPYKGCILRQRLHTSQRHNWRILLLLLQQIFRRRKLCKWQNCHSLLSEDKPLNSIAGLR